MNAWESLLDSPPPSVPYQIKIVLMVVEGVILYTILTNCGIFSWNNICYTYILKESFKYIRGLV